LIKVQKNTIICNNAAKTTLAIQRQKKMTTDIDGTQIMSRNL